MLPSSKEEQLLYAKSFCEQECFFLQNLYKISLLSGHFMLDFQTMSIREIVGKANYARDVTETNSNNQLILTGILSNSVTAA